jgi:putative aldouronate transport system permease protein
VVKDKEITSIKLYKSDYAMQGIAHMVLIILTLLALLPFVLLTIASFTDEQVAVRNGFTFIPEKWSLSAYQYLVGEWAQIGHAYLMTIIVTVIGTTLCLVFTTLLAYGLTRDIVGKRFLNFYVVFTMLFRGGIVSSYFVWTRCFYIKDTIWSLILPNLMISAFNIILIKNYFRTSVPESLIESAKIDGAGEFRTFYTIVLPLSKPIIATIGLMSAIGYWNDWTNGLYYVEDNSLYTIQLVLNRINESAQFLASNSTQMGSMLNGTASIPTTTMRMAIAVVAILPILVAYPFFQKCFVKGITIGAVKG